MKGREKDVDTSVVCISKEKQESSKYSISGFDPQNLLIKSHHLRQKETVWEKWGESERFNHLYTLWKPKQLK
jgi:hypothetical protein